MLIVQIFKQIAFYELLDLILHAYIQILALSSP